MNAKLLTENLRWNDEFKCYTAKVYTVEGAIMVREVRHRTNLATS